MTYTDSNQEVPTMSDLHFIDDATAAREGIDPDFRGDFDRRDVEDLDRAEVILSQYIDLTQTGDRVTDLVPVYAEGGTLEQMVQRYAEVKGLSVAMANMRLPKAFLDAVRGEKHRLGQSTAAASVSLDLLGVGGGRLFGVVDAALETEMRDIQTRAGVRKMRVCTQVKQWHPVPQVCFYEVQPGGSFWQAGHREAAAAWYVPPMPGQRRDGTYYVRFGTDRQTGEQFPLTDDFYPGGMFGVLRWFPSLTDAAEALSDLRWAVRTTQRPVRSAYTDDPVRTAVSPTPRAPETF